MRIVESDGLKLAIWFACKDLPTGLSFLTEGEQFVQVGGWRYDSGKELLAHNHHRVSRNADRTQEFVLVIKGAMDATIYDEEDKFVETVRVNAQEGLILLAGGHGYHILEDDTIVIETKNGPYPGAERDRRRLPVQP